VREQTLLTRERVTAKQTFLDWDTQPSSFKHYPHFCHRVRLSDHPSLLWLRETRCITDERTVVHKPYFRLNVPSAGNLHPIEIYLQLRNIEGIVSGIYHWDVLKNELVMISEIGSEGIEPFVGLESRFNGALVMISLVPFRTSWKYGLRGWRYLYLDLGHQIGALEKSVHHFNYTLTKMSPQSNLNSVMGLGADEVIAAVYGVGESSERQVKALRKSLMQVSPCDYVEGNNPLSRLIQNELFYTKLPISDRYKHFLRMNTNRRSARAFEPSTMNDAMIRALLTISASSTLDIIAVVLHAQSMQTGIYRKDVCIQRGNFLVECVHLLLDQRFIARANMVILITAEEFSASTHVDAGIYAHELYMACEDQGVGCSGIGAFYDEEAVRWSTHPLLYAVAIGGKYE
jgi:SagB-type dehydrogenase family enzyme